MRVHELDSQHRIADAGDPPPMIGTDERRMHVRAYNYWVSLLGGRPFPSIADLDPGSLDDFGPNSVLLDFTDPGGDPAILWLGRALREEGAIGDDVHTIAAVPGRSLLSRLTDHYLQIIANRAPIGFEAEFVSARGFNTMYRGILMPFSSDGATIDFIYGVINWKELADPALAAAIVAEATRATPGLGAAPPADGPSGIPADPIDVDLLPDDEDEDAALADRLAAARASAEAAGASDLRTRHALRRAVAHAYRFALAAEHAPDDYAELLADAGLKPSPRAPMTPVAKLVFGAGYDKTRLAEYAAVLAHARRLEIAGPDMLPWLEAYPGGLKAIVAAERAARRPEPRAPADPRAALREAPVAAVARIAAAHEFVLLVARREAADTVAILGTVPENAALLNRAIRHLAKRA